MIASLEWAVRALSFFNTIELLWLGLTVLLNAERRTWGTWLVGGGLALGGLCFAAHSGLVGGDFAGAREELASWWRLSWLPFAGAPWLWCVAIAWYARWLRGVGRLILVGAATALGLVALVLLMAVQPLAPPGGEAWPGGAPLALGMYLLFSGLCVGIALEALRRPGPPERFMGDLARRRARPWLVATSFAILAQSLAVGAVAAWFFGRTAAGRAGPGDSGTLDLLLLADVGVSGLVTLEVLLMGRAIVSYEIFTGKALPRGGLSRQWRNSLLLAAGFGGLMATGLALPLDPSYRLVLATLAMTVCSAVLSWRAYVEHEASVERLRPFVASQRLYERLVGPTGPPEAEGAEPFRALCGDVLGARVAYLVPVGSLRPLVGPGLAFPNAQAPLPPADWTLAPDSPRTICRPVDPASQGGAAWAVPLWSERGPIGVLLLGERRDGGLYTQEEIEIARATCERLIDARASAELARRLMALQRQRLAETQVLDRRARRHLHDEVLPRLHAALLLLGTGTNGASPEATGLLTETHRQITDLLRELPAAVAPEVAQLGLVRALRRAVEGELEGSFDAVTWRIDADGERAAEQLPPLASEALFCAAREAIRNAAQHGRGDEPNHPLHLAITVVGRNGLEVCVEDDGVGTRAASAAGRRGGQGLALHGTMMAVLGGTLLMEGRPGGGTRVRLSLPAGAAPEGAARGMLR